MSAFLKLFETGSATVPHATREKRTVEQTWDKCPNCQKEIGEKESFLDEKVGEDVVMIHSPCGGRYRPVPMSDADRAWLKKFTGESKNFDNVPKPDDLQSAMSEVSLGKDKKGYFVYTHRARSDSYASPHDIPKSKIEFIGSTG
jgi:hypothetical protein